ncbi:MAG: hypothetical protein ACRCWQ_08550 [Bacilli bacterium]
MFQFQFDRCFKVFSDVYAVDWFELFAPEICKNYTLVAFDHQENFASRLGEELLPEIPANKKGIVDRLYLLQSKNDPSKKLIFHLEFESTLSPLDYHKLLIYFHRIESAVTDIPVIHTCVLAPGISKQEGILAEISWETYRNTNGFPHLPIPYFPLYMENYEETHLNQHQRALWYLVKWAVRRRGEFKEKPNLEVCHEIWMEILTLYYNGQPPEIWSVMFSAMCALFGIKSAEYILLTKGLKFDIGGKMYSLYSVLSVEEREGYEREIQELKTVIRIQDVKIHEQELKIQEQAEKIRGLELRIKELELYIVKLEQQIAMLLKEIRELKDEKK